MNIGDITLAQASKELLGLLLKGIIWVAGMRTFAYFLDVEWTWRILVLCCIGSFLDKIIWD